MILMPENTAINSMLARLAEQIAIPEENSTAVIQWPELIPFSDALLLVEQFNLELLPQSLRDWVIDIAERMDNAPADFAAVGALVALSSLLGRKVLICPKRNDDWQVVPNLWGAVIGRPSSKKTPLLAEVMKPLQRLELEAKATYDEQDQTYENQLLLQKLHRKNNEDEAKKLLKAKKPHDAEALLKNDLEIEPPIRKRLVVNDPTVPKLGEILAQNPAGVLLFRDELTGFLKSLDREDRGQDRAFYLEAWNGSGRFTFDRIERGTVDIEAATVSILGAIQPAKLLPYLRAQKNGAGDDGLIERLQLMVYPDDLPFRHVDRHPNTDAKEIAYAVFERFNQFEMQGNIEDTPRLRFDPQAQALFDQWYCELKQRITTDDISPQLESHLGKYPSLMASLALILHLCDCSADSPVSEVATMRAMAWCEYLESHARRIYGLADDPHFEAKVLLKRLHALPNPFTVSDFANKDWAGLTDPDSNNRALKTLVERGYLHSWEERTQGRPKVLYLINPEWLEGVHG